MSWIEPHLELLSEPKHWGYRRGDAPAAEPLALAVLALTAHRRPAALPAGEALLTLQNDDGSLGIRQGMATPGWPTPWAVLAWQALLAADLAAPRGDKFTQAIQRAVAWLLAVEGEAVKQQTEFVGHDTQLVGWPWVQGTHSWLEPTAACVLALKATGWTQHPRTREAVRLLVDRLLPEGGCNYGNTFVLGQQLFAHVQPSGLALLALAGEQVDDPRVAGTIAFCRRGISLETTAASLAYALLGLAAHDEYVGEADAWLSLAARQTLTMGANLPRLALVVQAASGRDAPLVRLALSAAAEGALPP